MTDEQDIAIALLEEHQRDLEFEIRDADWSLEEIAHGVRPKAEKRAIMAKRRKYETALELTEKGLRELKGANT